MELPELLSGYRWLFWADSRLSAGGSADGAHADDVELCLAADGGWPASADPSSRRAHLPER